MSLLTKLIKAKKTFSIIELGCGIPVAHSIMQHTGSSKVITMASCPYNKQYQADLLGLDILEMSRSVSKEVVEGLLNTLRSSSKGESFHVAYSIQAGSSAKVCHGYVGICTDIFGAIFHVTLGRDMNKSIAGRCMESIVEDLIEYHILCGSMSTVGADGSTSFIDGAWSNHNMNTESFLFDATLLPMNFGTFCWSSGQWCRLVDVFRQLEGGLCLIKGSFNPMHDGHKQLVTAAKEFTNIPLMSMTTKTIDNKVTVPMYLIERTEKMIGYTCVIDSHNILMKDLIADLSKWDNSSRNIHLFMGIDVFVKFNTNDVNEDVKIHVYHRQCNIGNVSFNDSKFSTLSSTQIRNQNETSK